MTKKIIVAIDGYSSCGKSTMAKSLAREIGYTYIDTGAMYRAVTLFAIEQNLIDASGVVNHSELVKALPKLHIEFKLNEQSLPELYLNGERQAELKLFITADPKIRAERRLLELRSKGDEQTSFEDVLKNIEDRDYQDTHRAVSPLVQAEDAIVVDNSHLTREEQSLHVRKLFDEAVGA